MVMDTATKFSCKFSNIFIFMPVKCPAKRKKKLKILVEFGSLSIQYLLFNLSSRSDATHSVSLLLKYLLSGETNKLKK